MLKDMENGVVSQLNLKSGIHNYNYFIVFIHMNVVRHA